MSAAPAAIPPAHMASTIGGEIWRAAGIAGTVEDGTVWLMDGSWPSVAVVIPVLDEAESVGDAVRSALGQDYPGTIEVVVADGGSSDGTVQILERLAAADPRVQIVPNPAGSAPAGLNAAIRASNSDVIVRCDGHAILPPGYIGTAVETLLETGAGNVGGIQEATGEGMLQRAIAIAMSIPMGVGDARFHYGGEPGPTDTVYLGTFPRAVLEKVGLYDESLIRNQDYELNWRLHEAGEEVWFEPRLRVRYTPRADLVALWRQYYDYGRWKNRVIRRHPASLRPRQLAPPALVVGLSLSALAALAGRAALGAVVPGIYAGALGATAAANVANRPDPAALLLPLVLPVMHIAWGCGFIVGFRHG